MRAQFVRGQEPMDSMELGRVNERKIKKARAEMFKEIKRIAIEHWGGEVWEIKDNPYMRIKENSKNDNFVELGIEYTPEGPYKSSYFAYLVFVPDPDENESSWAAGYQINRKSSLPTPPNVKNHDSDEIPFDSLEDAVVKMEYYLKNF